MSTTHDIKAVAVSHDLYRIVNWDDFTPYDRNKDKNAYVFISHNAVYVTWANLQRLVNKNLVYGSRSSDIVIIEDDTTSVDFTQQTYLTTIEQDLYLHKVCEKIVDKYNFDYHYVEVAYKRYTITFVRKSAPVYGTNPFDMKLATDEETVAVAIETCEGFYATQLVFYSDKDKQEHLAEVTDEKLTSKVEAILKKREEQ